VLQPSWTSAVNATAYVGIPWHHVYAHGYTFPPAISSSMPLSIDNFILCVHRIAASLRVPCMLLHVAVHLASQLAAHSEAYKRYLIMVRNHIKDNIA
jgi:hypothetical protein